MQKLQTRLVADISKYTENFFMGMSPRQTIFGIAGGAVIALGSYLLPIPQIIPMLGGFALIAVGFFRPDGLPMEQFVKSWWDSHFANPICRYYEQDNIVYDFLWKGEIGGRQVFRPADYLRDDDMRLVGSDAEPRASEMSLAGTDPVSASLTGMTKREVRRLQKAQRTAQKVELKRQKKARQTARRAARIVPKAPAIRAQGGHMQQDGLISEQQLEMTNDWGGFWQDETEPGFMLEPFEELSVLSSTELPDFTSEDGSKLSLSSESDALQETIWPPDDLPVLQPDETLFDDIASAGSEWEWNAADMFVLEHDPQPEPRNHAEAPVNRKAAAAETSAPKEKAAETKTPASPPAQNPMAAQMPPGPKRPVSRPPRHGARVRPQGGRSRQPGDYRICRRR